MEDSAVTAQAFQPGDWVVRRDWGRLAKVKDFNPATDSLEATLDLVRISRHRGHSFHGIGTAFHGKADTVSR